MGKADEKAFRKAKRGRPPKLTDELIEKVCVYLRHGAYVETASAAAGISKVIFYRWLKIGEQKPKSIHGDFVNAIELAMAEGEVHDLAAISKARAKNWQASAWRLQRRHPNRWAATHRPPVPAADTDASSTDFKLNYDLEPKEDDDETTEPTK